MSSLSGSRCECIRGPAVFLAPLCSSSSEVITSECSGDTDRSVSSVPPLLLPASQSEPSWAGLALTTSTLRLGQAHLTLCFRMITTRIARDQT